MSSTLELTRLILTVLYFGTEVTGRQDSYQTKSVSDWVVELKHADLRRQTQVVVRFRELNRTGTPLRPSEENVGALFACLSDKEPIVRAWAAEALGTIPLGQIEIGIVRKTIMGLATCLLDADSGVRESAAWALNKNLEGTVRTLAGDSLGPLLLTALNDPSSEVRGNVAACLGHVGYPEHAVASIIALLNDASEFVAWNAASALGRSNSESAIDALIQALKRESPSVRANVLESLATIGRKANRTAVRIREFLNDDDDIVRSNAAAAVGAVGDTSNEGFRVLVVALCDRSLDVRASAVESIGLYRNRAVFVLIPKMIDRSRRVRSVAALTLSENGPAAILALPCLLIAAIGDPDSEVRESSRIAVRRILKRFPKNARCPM